MGVQRPDIGAGDRCQNKVILFQFSVAFETNLDDAHHAHHAHHAHDAHHQKVEWYAKLTSDIENNGYKMMYSPVEMSTTGYISEDNTRRLKSFLRHTTQQFIFKEIQIDL